MAEVVAATVTVLMPEVVAIALRVPVAELVRGTVKVLMPEVVRVAV